MKAITVRFYGPSYSKGSRYRAFDMDGNQVTIAADHSLSWTNGERYEQAAKALCEKMGWPGQLVGGAIKDGWVFVFVR